MVDQCADSIPASANASTQRGDATAQTCVVHLIRNSIKYCSWKDRKKVVAALKPIYTAATIDDLTGPRR